MIRNRSVQSWEDIVWDISLCEQKPPIMERRSYANSKQCWNRVTRKEPEDESTQARVKNAMNCAQIHYFKLLGSSSAWNLYTFYLKKKKKINIGTWLIPNNSDQRKIKFLIKRNKFCLPDSASRHPVYYIWEEMSRESVIIFCQKLVNCDYKLKNRKICKQ